LESVGALNRLKTPLISAMFVSVAKAKEKTPLEM